MHLFLLHTGLRRSLHGIFLAVDFLPRLLCVPDLLHIVRSSTELFRCELEKCVHLFELSQERSDRIEERYYEQGNGRQIYFVSYI